MNKNRSDVMYISTLVALLSAVFFCVQYHSIEFWTTIVGEETAMIWSVTAELIVIMAWVVSNLGNHNHIRKVKGLAFTATIVVMAAPILNNVMPLYDEWVDQSAKVGSYQAEIDLKHEQIQLARHNLEIANSNSQKRPGWSPSIDRRSDELLSRQAELEVLIKSKPGMAEVVPDLFKVALVSMAIVIFQMAMVVTANLIGDALRRFGKPDSTSEEDLGDAKTLRMDVEEYEKSSDTEVFRVAANSIARAELTAVPDSGKGFCHDKTTEDQWLLSLCDFVNRYIKDQETPQAEVARALNVSARDLSLLVNHRAKLEKGAEFRKISMSKAKAIATTLQFAS